MMQFKMDENMPDEAADVLRAAGHDAATALGQGLGGGADPTLAEICKREGRTLVSLDLDFADIRTYPPADYPGLIVLRPRSQAKSHVLALLSHVSDVLAQESVVGRLWIADESGIRVREGD